MTAAVLHRRLPCQHGFVRPTDASKPVRRRCRVCGVLWVGKPVASGASAIVGRQVVGIVWERAS